ARRPGHGHDEDLHPARCHGEGPLRGQAAITAPVLSRRVLHEEEGSLVSGHSVVAPRLRAAARTQPEAGRLHGNAWTSAQGHAEDIRSAVSPLVEGPAA